MSDRQSDLLAAIRVLAEPITDFGVSAEDKTAASVLLGRLEIDLCKAEGQANMLSRALESAIAESTTIRTQLADVRIIREEAVNLLDTATNELDDKSDAFEEMKSERDHFKAQCERASEQLQGVLSDLDLTATVQVGPNTWSKLG